MKFKDLKAGDRFVFPSSANDVGAGDNGVPRYIKLQDVLVQQLGDGLTSKPITAIGTNSGHSISLEDDADVLKIGR